MPILWGQAYEEDNTFYWCTEHIPHFNGSKIAVPVPVVAYPDMLNADPYVPFILVTKNHANILYKNNDIDNHEIRKITCLHFESELKYHRADEQSQKIKSGIFQSQRFFEQLMEDYDQYY
jgi:hypothetical protein